MTKIAKIWSGILALAMIPSFPFSVFARDSVFYQINIDGNTISVEDRGEAIVQMRMVPTQMFSFWNEKSMTVNDTISEIAIEANRSGTSTRDAFSQPTRYKKLVDLKTSWDDNLIQSVSHDPERPSENRLGSIGKKILNYVLELLVK